MTLQEFLNRYSYDPETDCIGEGGFGSVYKAYDNVLDREVAIKISAVRHIGGKTFSLKNECETVLSLPPHPNIACYDSVYSYQLPTGASDFAIIQYYPDGSLKGLIASGQLTPTQREELLWALLDGLEHLHSHNIIHRDLKPANILISRRMRGGDCVYVPKIADFGLSKAVDSQHSHISSSFAGGTLEYSSPEQLKGKPLRYNTDLWSWAVIAYEVLTGNKLFQAPTNSSAFAEGGVVDLIFGEDVSPKLALLDEPWQSFVMACLERNPDLRVRDVVALKQLLLTEEDPEPDPQPEPPLPPQPDLSPTEFIHMQSPSSSPPLPPEEDKVSKLIFFIGLFIGGVALVLLFWTVSSLRLGLSPTSNPAIDSVEANWGEVVSSVDSIRVSTFGPQRSEFNDTTASHSHPTNTDDNKVYTHKQVEKKPTVTYRGITDDITLLQSYLMDNNEIVDDDAGFALQATNTSFYAHFIVEKDGSITNISVTYQSSLNGTEKLSEQVAKRIKNYLKKQSGVSISPGSLNGMPVRVRVKILVFSFG